MQILPCLTWCKRQAEIAVLQAIDLNFSRLLAGYLSQQGQGAGLLGVVSACPCLCVGSDDGRVTL